MALADDMAAKRLNEGGLTDTRHPRQADTQGFSCLGRQQVQQPVASLTIVRMRRFDKRNCLPQRPPVARHNRIGESFSAVIGHLGSRVLEGAGSGSATAQIGLLELDDGLIDHQALALVHKNLGDRDVVDGTQTIFHLHRLDNADFFARLDLLPGFHG